MAITLELLWVPAGGKDTQRIVWEPFYGALPMGHYRIIKPVTDDRQRYLLAGEFTVN